MHLKMLSVKWRPFCPGGDELNVDKIPESLTDDKFPLFQVMASRWLGTKPLYEPMTAKIHDASNILESVGHNELNLKVLSTLLHNQKFNFFYLSWNWTSVDLVVPSHF